MSDTPRTDKRCLESQSLKSMSMRFAWMCDFARDLERENAALRADKERLDWLIQFGGATFYKRLPYSLSEAYIAIDTRRKEAQ